MSVKSDTVLTEEHYQALNRALEFNAQEKEILDKCVDLFPSLQEFCPECDQMRHICTKLKERFFPDRP